MEDRAFMEMALEEARKAALEGEVPVGALLSRDGKPLALGHNEREKGLDISAHAEIVVLRKAASLLGTWRLSGCTLYVTLEPCLMCAGAILQSHVSRLVFASKDPKDGAIVSRYRVYDAPSLHERPLVDFGVLDEECSAFLSEWFRHKRAGQE